MTVASPSTLIDPTLTDPVDPSPVLLFLATAQSERRRSLIVLLSIWQQVARMCMNLRVDEDMLESEKMALTENGEIEEKREIRESKKKKQQLGGIRTLPFIFGNIKREKDRGSNLGTRGGLGIAYR
ncbi:hypothetical protein LguiB_033366 [Lonicera macranthoides]